MASNNTPPQPSAADGNVNDAYTPDIPTAATSQSEQPAPELPLSSNDSSTSMFAIINAANNKAPTVAGNATDNNKATNTSAQTEKKAPQRRPSVGADAASAAVVPTPKDNDALLFYEDEVFDWDRQQRLRFGLVTETYDASYSDSEHSDEENILQRGEVRVAWHPRGNEEILLETHIGLADRTLMPGDVVRRCLSGQRTQKGYCRKVNVFADVWVKGTEWVLRGVRATRLRTLTHTVRDNAVCLDSWVGSSKSVCLKLVLRTRNGSVLELRPDQEMTSLYDADTEHRRGFFANTTFYVGQQLVGSVKGLEAESARWLTTAIADTLNPKGRKTFIVESVEVEGMTVHWRCKALSDCSDLSEEDLRHHVQPKSYVTGDDLKRLHRLNIFESCMLQINDLNYLRIEPEDAALAVKRSTWRRQCSQLCRKYMDVSRRMPDRPADTAAAATAGGQSVPSIATVTAADAALDDSDGWITDDDGAPLDGGARRGKGAASIGSLDSVTTASTCSIPTPRSNQRRLLKNINKLLHIKRESQRPSNGVQQRRLVFDIADKVGEELVTETRLVYSTATVVWQDGTIEENISSRQLFPIHHLDEHEFFPGDFVLAGDDGTYRNYGVVQRVDHAGRTATVKWFTTYTSIADPQPTYCNETEVSVYDLKDHPDFQYRPGTIVIRVANFSGEDETCTAGQVIDNYAEGRVMVWWVDGHSSMCWPQDLFEVGNYDADHNYWTGDESDDESDDDQDDDHHHHDHDHHHSIADDLANALIDRVQPAADADADPEADSKCLNLLDDALEQAVALSDQNSWATDSDSDDVPNIDATLPLEPGSNTKTINTVVSKFGEEMRAMANTTPIFVKSIQRLLSALDALHEVFRLRPVLVNEANMAQLLTVYKKCRYMDRLLGTVYFHEDNLRGLIERVRHTAATTTPNAAVNVATLLDSRPASIMRAIDHKRRFFGKLPAATSPAAETASAAPTTETATNSVPPLAAQHPLKMPPLLSPAGGGSMVLHQRTASAVKLRRMSEGVGGSGSVDRPIKVVSLTEAMLSPASSSVSQAEWGEASGSSTNTTTTTSTTTSTTTTTTKNSSSTQSNRQRQLPLSGDDNTTNSCASIACDDAEPEQAEEAIELNVDQLLHQRACMQLCSTLRKQMRAALLDVSDTTFRRRVAAIWKEPPPDTPTATPPETETPTSDSGAIQPVYEQSPDCFAVHETAPSTHFYAASLTRPVNAAKYYRTIASDHALLQASLPHGVWVRAYEDRMDLLSCMIAGPAHTPYEDGMFLFDVQLTKDYPRTPPLFHYISFCADRLNPNLYEDGKVCVSLLGTWSGKGLEVWNPLSTLLQVIVSIQGLILVAEPYFNEAGYEKQKGCQQGIENSRMYNEMVVIKLVQSTTKLLQQPADSTFREQIVRHFSERGRPMYERLRGWLEVSNAHNSAEAKAGGESSAATATATAVDRRASDVWPEFPLVPASRGFCLSLAGLLEILRAKFETLDGAAGNNQTT